MRSAKNFNTCSSNASEYQKSYLAKGSSFSNLCGYYLPPRPPPRVGVLRVGVERVGVDLVGVLRVGDERVGVLLVGVDRVGVERVGVLLVGVDRVGVLRVGVLRVGVDRVGVDLVGVLRVGVVVLVGLVVVGVLVVVVPHVNFRLGLDVSVCVFRTGAVSSVVDEFVSGVRVCVTIGVFTLSEVVSFFGFVPPFPAPPIGVGVRTGATSPLGTIGGSGFELITGSRTGATVSGVTTGSRIGGSGQGVILKYALS